MSVVDVDFDLVVNHDDDDDDGEKDVDDYGVVAVLIMMIGKAPKGTSMISRTL